MQIICVGVRKISYKTDHDHIFDPIVIIYLWLLFENDINSKTNFQSNSILIKFAGVNYSDAGNI